MLRSLTIVFLLGVFASVGLCDEDKKSARRKARQADAATEAVQGALPPELTSLFPIDREFKGVAIPSYDGDRLKSVMRADRVTRVSEQYMDLVNLTVELYNQGEPETTISMAEAVYDLVLGELTSKTPSKIEQPRFTMTGDKMIFQTHTQTSRLVGNVLVIVPDAGSFTRDFGFPNIAPK